MKVRVIATRIGISLLVLGIASCTYMDEAIESIPEPTYTPIPTVIEPGLAYGDPCKPPCWWGLIPGQSTREDAAQAMEQIRDSGWARYAKEIPGGYAILPHPLLPPLPRDIIVSIDNGAVDVIWGQVEFYHPVGTLVEQFGAPEGIYQYSKGGACSFCQAGKPLEPPTEAVPSSSVGLLYPNQGLLFWMLVPDHKPGCICPEMEVTGFCYYAPISMQEALDDDYLANLCSSLPKGITEEDLIEWHGFGGGY